LLEELKKQAVDKNTFIDILVVDNACDHETKRIVEVTAANSPFHITYETESTPGIVAARNKCVEFFLLSDSQNLFFIDDDEWPNNTDWAQTMLDKKSFYSADVVTSHVLSVGEPGTPDWAVNLIYGECSHHEGDKLGIFYTNNLLISREVLEAVKPAFDVRFAMTGASDYHFALKCVKKGFKAVYVNAPVEEEFPRSRATIKWFIKRGFRSGIGFTRAHLYEEPFITVVVRSCIMSAVRFFRGIFYILTGCILLSKLKIVDGFFRISSAVGTLAGFFGIKHNEYNVIHGK
jgi:glycosyltransferase involved in cell wall biosynthesis